MDLGEAVQGAVKIILGVLLSTEAAGQLKDMIQVGRMKGRPGALTITSSDGLAAPPPGGWWQSRESPSSDGSSAPGRRSRSTPGARQMVRQQLEDETVLLGRQKKGDAAR